MKKKPNSNRHIIKRFFFRKTANNRTDIFLPLIFITIIAFSTALIVFNSFIIYKYQQEINQFSNNNWNKIYYLYLGDSHRKEVNDYLTTLENDNIIDVKTGFTNYPFHLRIASKDTSISNILTYAFTPDFNFITENIDLKPHKISAMPYIFLSTDIMEKLKIKNDDIIFIKKTNIEKKYKQALIVKEVKNSSQFRSFIFQNYLSTSNTCLIRLYYKNFDRVLEKAITIRKKDKLPPPYHFGYRNIIFGGIIKPSEKLHDKIIRCGYVPEKYKNQEKIILNDSLFLNENLKYKLDPHKYLLIDYKDIDNENFEFSKENNVQVFQNTHNQYFLQISMTANYSKITNLENRPIKQFRIFDYIADADSFAIISQAQKFKRSNLTMFIKYDKLDDLPGSKKILQNLNFKNVRWDSGRWSTIIYLNKSLKEGKQNNKILIILCLSIFILFLIVKFLLRLKLEYHTVGVLKCFGGKNYNIFSIYILGYLTLVLSGFFLGIIFSFVTGYMAGFSTNLIFGALLYYLTHPLNHIYLFLLLLILSTIIAIPLTLLITIKKEEIYELIKYEG